jgi:tagatose 1,6-diphosphate aldolase GatY/KbaY
MDLVRAADARGYALGGFNVYNLEGARAVIQAAEAERSPVIIQMHPGALTYGGMGLVALCLVAAHKAEVEVGVHLDHSTSYDDMQRAMDAGVTSVMADGSHLPFDENVAYIQRAVEQARAKQVGVEAELGSISGTEDNLTVADYEARMTDPAQAADFVLQTGVDALAVCIGNVHGHYHFPPNLDFDRLARINEVIDVPLALHGASGLSAGMITRAVELGVRKFNIDTEVRQAFVQSLHQHLGVHGIEIDLVPLLNQAIDAMQLVIQEKIRLFGSSGSARK